MQQLLAGRMKKLPSSNSSVCSTQHSRRTWKLIAVGGLLGLAVGVFQVSPLIQSLAPRASLSCSALALAPRDHRPRDHRLNTARAQHSSCQMAATRRWRFSGRRLTPVTAHARLRMRDS